MSAIIQNKIISIIGFPGSWKTFLSAFLSFGYPVDRIFANLDIKKYNKQVSKRINNIDDLQCIKFNERKGLLILDELGINANSRRSMTDQNLKFGEIAILSRKTNTDLINCAQLNGMADKYFRDLSTYRFEMESYFERKDYLMFEAKVYNKHNALIKIVKFDLFKVEDYTGITYNTLESSRIEKSESFII